MAELRPFALNPDLEIQVVRLHPEATVVMVDDFLADPGAARDWAIAHAADFSMPERAYPGKVLAAPAKAMEPIERFIRYEMSRAFSFFRAEIHHQAQFSLTTLQPADFTWIQRLCHTDPRLAGGRENFASLLYLFDDPELGGTGFYRYRDPDFWQEIRTLMQSDPDAVEPLLRERYALFRDPPRYMTASNEVTELLDMAPARYNRFLFYWGAIPHSAYIEHPERLTGDPATGRLTLNCFASVLPKR